MAASTSGKPKIARTILGVIAAAAGWGGGYVLSEYSRGSFWIPGALAVVFLLLGVRLLPADRKPLALALALGAAHVGWFAAGVAAAGGIDIAIELIVYAALLLWLGLRPNLVSMGVLVAYEGVALAVNVLVMLDEPIGSAGHRSLVIHVLLRVAVIASAIPGVLVIRQARRAAAPA